MSQPTKQDLHKFEIKKFTENNSLRVSSYTRAAVDDGVAFTSTYRGTIPSLGSSNFIISVGEVPIDLYPFSIGVETKDFVIKTFWVELMEDAN